MFSKNHGKVLPFSTYGEAEKEWKLWRGRGYAGTWISWDEGEDKPYKVIIQD